MGPIVGGWVVAFVLCRSEMARWRLSESTRFSFVKARKCFPFSPPPSRHVSPAPNPRPLQLSAFAYLLGFSLNVSFLFSISAIYTFSYGFSSIFPSAQNLFLTVPTTKKKERKNDDVNSHPSKLAENKQSFTFGRR